jgi:hypothetical protein
MSQGRYESSELTAVSRRFLDAFSAANIDGMRALLVEDMVAYITNGSGGMDEVGGAIRAWLASRRWTCRPHNSASI